MGYYEYIVRVWDEIDEKEEERCGVTSGKNLSEATDNITQYYGDELIKLLIFPLEEAHCYELNWNCIDEPGLFKIEIKEINKEI